METAAVHQLWHLVESTQASTLLAFNDASLTDWLVMQLRYAHVLGPHDLADAQDYVRDRLSLIRDLAWERLL